MPRDLESLDWNHLARFDGLKSLYLEGQANGIEVLSGLHALEEVTLRSITTADLRYLEPLTRLWSLDIKLGGIRSFRGIEGKSTIKYLQLWQIRELASADVLASLPGLQNVFLQSLPNIKALPALQGCSALRRVFLQNMKGFHEFGSLEHAPALEEFALLEGKGQQPEQLLPVLRNSALRRAKALFGSERRNDDICETPRRSRKERLESMGTLRVPLTLKWRSQGLDASIDRGVFRWLAFGEEGDETPAHGRELPACLPSPG